MYISYQQGFGTWNRRDFNAFVKASELHGRDNIKVIAADIESKTEDEVQQYANVFWKNHKSLPGMEHYPSIYLSFYLLDLCLSNFYYSTIHALSSLPIDSERIIKNIEKGEQKIKRLEEMTHALDLKINRYKDPWKELKIIYGQNKGRGYTEEEDQFLVTRPQMTSFLQTSS